MIINWTAVSVIFTVLTGVVGAVWILFKTIYSAKNDTAIPAEQISNLQAQITALSNQRLEDRVIDLERRLQESMDREDSLRLKVAEQGYEIRAQQSEIEALRLELAGYRTH